MAFLIADNSTARFSSTYAINSGATQNRVHTSGNDTQGLVASATANAATLWLYISSWGSVANIKACIYNNSNALVETVVVPSSVGTGLVSVALAGTTSITSGDRYRLGIYTDSNNAITLYTDTAGLTLRTSTASGNYTTPIDPLPACSFDSNNEFYWAVEDAAAALTIDSTDANMQRDTDFDVTFSNPATSPTSGNTTLSNGGDTLSSPTISGAGPYTATFAVGDLSKQVDATGYNWTLTVDAETDTTGNIPLLIQTGWTKVDLTSPITTDGSLLYGYTGDTPVTGDDLEYIVTSALDSGVTLDVAATAEWTINETTPGDWVTDITVNRRVVQADGTIGGSAVITLSASGTTDKLVRNVVKSTLSNITLGVMR